MGGGGHVRTIFTLMGMFSPYYTQHNQCPCRCLPPAMQALSVVTGYIRQRHTSPTDSEGLLGQPTPNATSTPHTTLPANERLLNVGFLLAVIVELTEIPITSAPVFKGKFAFSLKLDGLFAALMGWRLIALLGLGTPLTGWNPPPPGPRRDKGVAITKCFSGNTLEELYTPPTRFFTFDNNKKLALDPGETCHTHGILCTRRLLRYG